jgi:UDP-glucose 4-epimerase
MSKIIVTGGAGFIGSHTVVELINAGYEPVIIDDFSNSDIKVLDGLAQITGQTIKTYKANCNDETVLEEVFVNEKPSGIIHFAAFKAVGESVNNPLKYYDNNLGSTIKLLKKMKQHQVSNLVFSSSCTVYGQPDSLPVSESTPTQPATSPYGNTKKMCEDIIRDSVAAIDGLNAISLRYFNPIGAHESALIGELPKGVPANLVPFITQTASGLRDVLSVFGSDYPTSDGTCIRDYIHVVDLAKAHVSALNLLLKTSENHFYDTFNIGTGQGNTVLEVINAFEESTGQKLNYQLMPRRAGDVVAVYADVAKSKEKLGWQTEKTLQQALADAWRWQLAIG